ncbi:MAG: SRPBCC domain-containing protein [Bacteroidales bacterium]
MANKIRVEVLVNASLEKVWSAWVTPTDIENWYFASPDWYVPAAENDLQVGRKFKTVMSSRDKTMVFDFEGTYTEINHLSKIVYVLADDRVVETTFLAEPDGVRVIQLFDPENQNPVEMQQFGWQAILNNFKSYIEGLK